MTADQLKKKERVCSPHHHIDPGFINHRLCLSTFGSIYAAMFDRHKATGDDHLAKLRNDHLLVELALMKCEQSGVPTLGQLLQEPQKNALFCSTERLKPNKDVYTKERITVEVLTGFDPERKVLLEFHTQHIVSDTGKVEIVAGSMVSIVGAVHEVTDEAIILRPLIMGAPSYDHPSNKAIEPFNDDAGYTKLMFMGLDAYEILAGDIKEFSKIEEQPEPSAEEWTAAMRDIPEADIKKAFCEILGDVSKKDWGGEQDDHFTASLTLDGRQRTGAFLFKGPSRFVEMTPELLGKRGDQIYRLACTPANILIVQHCHHVGEAVRATLRAFAVPPHNPRHFCVIDGKSTYRLLKAYGRI